MGTTINKQQTIDNDRRTGSKIYPGTFVGEVMYNQDPQLAGRVWVFIPEFGGVKTYENAWVPVSYASPFYGISPHSAPPVTGFQNPDRVVEQQQRAQKTDPVSTYGFWAIAPDVGSKVLCTFVRGNFTEGYWYAVIPTLAHGMIPAIGAPDGKTPMMDFNPLDPKVPVTEDLTSIERQPYQPLATQLSTQGINEDPVRGPITSSSFRESPSRVFGISSQSTDTTPGHTFVMDDGSADGKNKLIRLRTSSGNQITMHDDTGMIYLINAGGTGWIELSPSGQIDVYGQAGINLATDKGDINLHAENNVNIHANKCVKIVGMTGTKIMGGEELQLHGKKTMIEGVDSLHVHSCKEMMITSFGDIHMKAFNYFCLKGKCFYWNSCTAKEAEQVPPEQPQSLSGYNTTVARAPAHEPYKEHDNGQSSATGAAGGPASGATSGSMTGAGSSAAAGTSIGGSGQPFNFNGSQQQAFDTVYAAAVKANSPDPRMTASVAMLESDYLGSSMTQRANNPFGQTITPSEIGKNGVVGGTYGADGQLHAVYDNVDSAVADHVRRWGSSYVPGNSQQTTANLVGKGYNTVNPAWSGSVNNIYVSSKNTNKPVKVNTTPATSVSNTSATTTKASTASSVSGSASKSTNYTNITNASNATVLPRTASTNPTTLQKAVKTSNGSTVTSTYNPSTNNVTGYSGGAPVTTKTPSSITVTKSNTTQVGPNAGTAKTSTSTQTIDTSSVAANPYLGRGGQAPVGADPALANVPKQSDQQPNGMFDSPNPADKAATGAPAASPAQDATDALSQMGGQMPSSDLPPAAGGGNTGCFATGDNCDRPADQTGGGGAGGQQGADQPQDLSPEEIAAKDKEVYDQLVAEGVPPDEAAAITARWKMESGNWKYANAYGDFDHQSYGIAQWRGDRLTGLFNKCGSSPSISCQVSYASSENQFHSAVAQMKTSSNMWHKTETFRTVFEGAKSISRNDSQVYANANNFKKTWG